MFSAFLLAIAQFRIGYLFHLILGHDVEPQTIRDTSLPADLSAPNIPMLNQSQIAAVKSVLQKPLSLIQVILPHIQFPLFLSGILGPSWHRENSHICYHRISLISAKQEIRYNALFLLIFFSQVQFSAGQVLVCAPSNISVDQLAEKIHSTGLKVLFPSITRNEISVNCSFTGRSSMRQITRGCGVNCPVLNATRSRSISCRTN